MVAIKLLEDIFRNELYAKIVVSEIQTMRKLTSLTKVSFTTELLDVIIPSDPEHHGDVFIVMEFVDFDIKKLL